MDWPAFGSHIVGRSSTTVSGTEGAALDTGSLSRSLPSWASCKITAEVIVLVIEAIRKWVLPTYLCWSGREICSSRSGLRLAQQLRYHRPGTPRDLDPRRRAEKALVAVVAECHVRGVRPRRVDGSVKTLGIESLSKSQVSRMAAQLDEMVTGASFTSCALTSACSFASSR